MNILDVLNKNKDTYRFQYYGIDDMATSFDVNLLIGKHDEIIEYFSSKEKDIVDYDDFIDYLFAKKNTQFSEVTPHIKLEVKEKFEEIIVILSNYLNNINVKNILNYLNGNVDFLLSEKNNHLSEQVFEIAFKYFGGCRNIILELIDKKFYLILDHFNDIAKIINSDEEYVNRTLDVSKFNEIKTYRMVEYLKMIEWYVNSNKQKDLTNNIIDEIIKYENEIYELINEDNVIEYDQIINNIYCFFVSIKHKEAYIIEEKNKNLQKIKDKYLEKHGKEFSYEIPIKDLLKPFEDEKINDHAKLLMLTHSKDESGQKLESVYAKIGRNSKKNLVDMFYYDFPNDDYFTFTKQQALSINDSVYLNVLKYYACEERIKKLMSMTAAELKAVCKYYSIDYEDLECDFNILLNCYLNLFNAYKSENEYLIKGLNYGIIMFQCGITEKLLRNFYKSQRKDTYIKIDWYSLGNILNPNDEMMLKFFDENDIKIFRYYLLDGCNGKIGLNYRNNFAHYKNMNPNDMHYGITLKILHILLTIINDLALTAK